MFRRPVTWFVLSLLCVAGVIFFFRTRHEPKNQVAQSSPEAESSSVGLPKAPEFISKIPKKYESAWVARGTNWQSYIFRNTSKTEQQITHDPHVISLENAKIDTDLLRGLGKRLNFNIPEHLRMEGDPGAYIVQSFGPPDNRFRAALASAGATIITFIPNNAYLVRMSESGAQQMASKAQAVLPYEPVYKLKANLLKLAVDNGPLPPETMLNVSLFSDARADTIADIERAGGQVLAETQSPFGPLLVVRPPNNWSEMALLPGVQMLELFRERVPANDLMRQRLGVATGSVVTNNYLNLSGTNVLVAVIDSGISYLHPDLTNRVIADVPSSLVDSNGHGTHVAATIAGSGAVSATVSNAQGSIMPAVDGQFRGMAPQARLFSSAVANGIIRSDVYLQEAAAKTNAFISNNSWNYSGDTTYSMAAASYDAAVRDALPGVTGSQPMVFVFPAGNQGAGNDSGLAGSGDSIVSPATAKNVLTIGAIEQERNITNTVNIDPNVTNRVAVWQPMTDTDFQVASYSSRGNVGVGIEGESGRFKPDLVAPGSMVISARSLEWDQSTYYQGVASFVVTNTGIGIPPNGYYTNSVFLPPNIVFLVVAVLPNAASPTNLFVPIYVNPGGFGAPVGTPFINGFSSPNDLPLTPVNTSWGYVLQNTNNQPINFDLITLMGLTNTVGDYYIALSNLNASLGTNSYYRYEGGAALPPHGTSMAAAGASGTLALLEDFFTNNFAQTQFTPSPALLKAMLISGARSVNGLYDLQATKPVNFQGWGLINLPNSLPSDQTNVINGIKKLANTSSSVLLFDQDGTNALATGQSHTRFIKLFEDAQFLPLRFTLVWTDPPGNPVAGRKLVNDLNLIVTNIDTGEVYIGNNIPGSSAFTIPWNPTDTNSVQPIADAVNNVENVFIFSPFSGTNFSVTVYATNVNVNAVSSHPNDVVQDYALVISSGDGELTNALSFDLSKGVNGLVTNASPQLNIATMALSLTGTNTQVASTNVTGQRVGANTPLLGTANGMTNQWHFYVIPDSTGFTNFAFGTDLARNLSIPRIGTREQFVINAARADQGVTTADIDLYVSTNPGLTNLDAVVIANAAKSLGRSGVETVFLTNTVANQVFYVGVKSEDQMAAEYTFFAASSLAGFNGDSPTMLEGSEVVPDGNAVLPGHTINLRALWNKEGQIRRVIVTNSIFSENLGDLVGTMYIPGGGKFVTLNNHRSMLPGDYTFIYEDNGEEIYFDNGITSLRRTDGPGNLQTFIGEPNPRQWYFEFVDDSLTQTSVVQNIGIRVDTEDPSGSGFECIRPGGLILHSVNIPGNATTLTICLDLTNAPGPLELFIRKDAPPTTTAFDVHQTIVPPSGCASIGQASTPPLSAGRYYWMVFNTTSNEQCYSYSTLIDLAGSSLQSIVRTILTNRPVGDDSVGTYYLTNNSHATISSIDVGLLIRHPRISDLAITLIAPNGTRILLFEDRGMLASDLGTLGTLTPTTNLLAYYTNDFDSAPVGLYANGAVLQGWNVYSNLVAVMDDFQCLCLSNHMLVLGRGVVSNSFPVVTNSIDYQLSFKVTHAPYLVGMVGWWPFDKSGRDIFGGMDALMCCNILYATGMVNQAYYSDGLGTVAQVPGGPQIDVGARWPHSLTIEGWINPANVTNAAPLAEWNQSTNLVNPLGVQFWLSGQFTTNAAAPPGTLSAAIWDQNQNLPPAVTPVAKIATDPMAITNKGWQHVALTYDGGSGMTKLYVNGNPVKAVPLPIVSPRTWGDLYFGFTPAGPSAGTHFAGGMDEFALYDRALSDCEIMAIYSVTNRGKYGTNVLTCPVTVDVDTPGYGAGTYSFVNGAAWSTNGPAWETNYIKFTMPSLPGLTNRIPVIVRSTNANVALDQFVLSSVVTNYIEGLMHFVEDTNLTQTLIKFAVPPFTATNFQPFVVFTNDFETATQSVYVANDIIRGSPNDPTVGQRDWRVALRPASPVSVVSNANFSATGSNWVALARGALQCDLPTRTGHRYELSYTLRGPCAVSWWNGEIEPFSRRARDLISANHGAFLYYATNSTTRRFVGNTLHLPGMITNIPPGVDDIAGKIELGDPFNLRFTNAMTLEGWIYPTLPDTWPTNGLPFQEQLFFRGDQRTCADPYYLSLTDFLFETPTQVRANLRFHIDNIADSTFNSCGVDLVTTNWPIAFDQWTHIAAVFEATPSMTNDWWYTNVMRLYTNGVQLTNIVWLNAQRLAYGTNALIPFRDLEPDFSPGITIGNRSRVDASQPYSGNIDEFTAYARALTQPELRAIATARTAGKFDSNAPPTLSLARARVALNGVEVDRAYAENSEWMSRTISFTANATNMTLTLESLLPGTLVDEVTLTEVPQELYYLPEESLASLVGMDGFGLWRLEIWDTRTGAFVNDPELIKWQLDLRLLPQNLPPVISLAHGMTYTNSIGANSVQYFTVDVPQWATLATNILAYARRFGLPFQAPVTVLFNQTNQPTGADLALIGPSVPNGTNTMTTNGTPPLVIGQTYYLAVTNPNPYGVTFALNVSFDITPLPTCESVTNIVGPAGIPRYFQFDVDTNTQATTLWVYGANTNLTVVLSQTLPLPDLAHQDYISARPSTNNEIVMVVTNSTPFPLQTNRWYAGVYNLDGGPVQFTIQACPTNYPVIVKLTNAVPFDAFFANSNASFVARPGPPRTVFFEFDINDFEDAVLFELYGLSGNADLVLQRYVPPGMAPYYRRSFQVSSNAEQIVLRSGFDAPDLRGKWFLGVYNLEATNVQYTIRASVPTNGMLISGQPIVMTNSAPVPSGAGNLLSWNAVEGERYEIQYTTMPTPPPGIVQVGPVMYTNNNHFYYILTTTNWNAAEAEAVSLGGHLVTINDAQENQWLWDVLAKPYDSLWIGFNDFAVEGSNVWTSGEPVTYVNWRPLEPNGGTSENAVAIGTNSPPGSWFDAQASLNKLAIVEVNGFTTNWTTIGTQIAASSCATFLAPCFGPISWWPAENSAIDVVDGNNGTLAGGANYLPGRWGNAFNFNGTTASVNVPRATNLLLSNQLTMEFWMKPDPSNPMNTCCQGLFATDFYHVEVSAGAPANPTVGINLSLSVNNGALYTHTADANGGGAVVTPGVWHHVAATYNGVRMQMYIDGMPWGRPMAYFGNVSPMLANSFLTFGSEDGRTACPPCVGTRHFRGLIDEPALYNRPLSAAEVQAIYLANSSSKCAIGVTFRAVQVPQFLTIPLPPYKPITNTIAQNSIQVFSVRVPSWATAATNQLITANGPVNVIFNQFTPPPAPGDVIFQLNATTGTNTILTTGTTPPLVPSSRYFLAVQNPGLTPVSVVLEVDFDYTQLTNGVPFDSLADLPSLPRYFYYDVSPNASLVTYEVYNMSGNVDLVGRQGLSLPDLTSFAFAGMNPGTLDENVLIASNTVPPVAPGRTYLGVFDRVPGPATYTIRATEYINPAVAGVISLTNAIPYCYTNTLLPSTNDYYHFVVTNGAVRAQFEINNPSGDMTLAVRKGLPLPTTSSFDYISTNALTNDELIVVLTNSSPVALTPGDWFISAINVSGAPVSYCIKATQWGETGRPFVITNAYPAGNSFCLTWNSLPGVHYYVQGVTSLPSTNWVAVSPTITAVDYSTTWCISLPSPYHYFRVVEGLAIAPAPVPPPPPQIISITHTNNTVELRFTGGTNALYRVQWSPGVSPAVWNTFTNILGSPTGLFLFVDDGSQTFGLAPMRYYRVLQL